MNARSVVLALALALLAYRQADAAPETPRIQSTTGANSPIFNQNTGPVYYLGAPDQGIAAQALRDAARRLGARGDLVSRQLRSAIARGDFDAAQKLVGQAIIAAASQVEQVALLKYVEGMLLMMDRRTVEAEASMRVANALQPTNCTYLGIQANLLVTLDRMTEGAALVRASNPDISRCLGSSATVDRVILLSAATWIAMQQRDESGTRASFEAADLALDRLILEPGLERIEIKISLACQFPRFARSLFREVAANDILRYVQRCQKFNARLGEPAENYAKLWLEESYDNPFKDEVSAAEKFRLMSEALQALDSSRPALNFGFSSLWMQLKRADLLSNRGFHRLWKLQDAKGAREDYALAYQTISPLLVAQRPEVWSSYRFLALRLIGFNELFPTMRLDTDVERIGRDASLLVRAAPFQDSMPLCEVLYPMRQLARSLSKNSSSQLVDAIDARRNECLANMLDKSTLRYQYATYQSRLIKADRAVESGDFAAAEVALSDAFEHAGDLFGFPIRLETDFAHWERVVQRGALRHQLQRDQDAEADYRTAVRLSRTAGNTYQLSNSLIYLAELIAWRDRAGSVQALAAADEGASLYWADVSAAEVPRCASIFHFARAGVLAARISIGMDDYKLLMARLDRLAVAGNYVSRCSDVATKSVKVGGDELNMSRAVPLVMVSDARLARDALQGGNFASVLEAAIASRDALEGAIRPFDAAGIKRSNFPMLDLLLRIAGSETSPQQRTKP